MFFLPKEVRHWCGKNTYKYHIACMEKYIPSLIDILKPIDRRNIE